MNAIIMSSSTELVAWMRQISRIQYTKNALSDNENIFAPDGTPKFEKAILALQNYKGLWLASMIHEWPKKRAQKILMVEYVNNIIAYHAFSGDKIIVRYEDVYTDKEKEGKKLLDFLDITDEIPKQNLWCWGKCEDLDADYRKNIDDLYRKRLGRLYETYLAEYSETKQ